MSNIITIKGVEYVLFSCERKDMGGRYSKKEAIELLKENGIKTSATGAYTMYVGHYGLYVEAKFEDKASDLLYR